MQENTQLNTTQKKQKHAKQQNKTTLFQSPLTTFGQHHHNNLMGEICICKILALRSIY